MMKEALIFMFQILVAIFAMIGFEDVIRALFS